LMKIMATSFKRSHAPTATLSAPNPEAGHHPAHASAGDSWTQVKQQGGNIALPINRKLD